MATDRALTARGLGKFLARRDALAIILTVVLWLTGLSLRPDYWWNLPNSFAILLNYTELALLTIGLTYVIAAGDIDLSVGAVLALAGSTAAYCLKVLGLDPVTAVRWACSPALAAGLVNALAHGRLRAAGLHRHARHVLHRPRPRRLDRRRPAAHRLARELQPARPQDHRHPRTISASRSPAGSLRAVAEVVSVQTLWMLLVALVAGDRARLHAVRPDRSTPPAATCAPPTMPASTPTGCASSR